MRNGNISEQLKMQEKQIADEKRKMNTDVQIGTDTEKIGNKLTNFQNAKSENDLSNLIEDKQENKQSFNLPDLGLSSALGIFTLEPGPDTATTYYSQEEKEKTQAGILAVVRLDPNLFPAPMSVISAHGFPAVWKAEARRITDGARINSTVVGIWSRAKKINTCSWFYSNFVDLLKKIQ